MDIKYTRDNEKVIEFLNEHNAGNEHVDCSSCTIWAAAILDGMVVGVLGLNIGTIADRFKGFYILKEYRKKGIGTAMLNDMLKYACRPIVTSYCTDCSERIFINLGFSVTRCADKNGISFLEKNTKQFT